MAQEEDDWENLEKDKLVCKARERTVGERIKPKEMGKRGSGMEETAGR